MGFGKKIKALREERQLTQSQLANALGTTLKTISNYETKDMRPRKMETYKKIAEFFGVNVNYLLTEEDSFILHAGMKFGSKGAKRQEMRFSLSPLSHCVASSRWPATLFELQSCHI